MKEKIKVLVVDDDKSTRKLYAQLLKKNHEYHVTAAKNGEEALKKIKKSVPDIILCDLYMPVMNGLELCRFIKSDPDSDLANIYIIMISTGIGDESSIQSINEWVDDYLSKPVKTDELLARIKVGQQNLRPGKCCMR